MTDPLQIYRIALRAGKYTGLQSEALLALVKGVEADFIDKLKFLFAPVSWSCC